MGRPFGQGLRGPPPASCRGQDASVAGESARRRGEALAAAGDAEARKWFAGAEGELRVAQALAAMPPHWTVVHDRLLMPGLTESNLDHVLIGPTGVVIVDAKNYSGAITVWNDSLYQHLGARDKRASRNLAGELRRVHWMAVEVGSRLRTPVTPVLCLAGNRERDFGDAQLVQGVWVVPLHRLVPWLCAPLPRLHPAEVLGLVPRVLSEFPATTTDPDLLAAIGHDLARAAPTRSVAAAGARRPPIARPHALAPPASGRRTPPMRPPRKARRSPSGPSRLLRFVLLLALLFGVAQLLPGLARVLTPAAGQIQAGVVAAGQSIATAPVTSPPSPVPTVVEELPCDALSEERLATYLKTTVVAWHGEDGTCRWFLDRADPSSVVLEARRLSPATVKHLVTDTVSVSPWVSRDPAGQTSLLTAREGQWIPVADTRTLAKWPMRVEIHRSRLGIDHHHGDQILRAVAKDLSS